MIDQKNANAAPANQTDESKGTVKEGQIADGKMQGKDLPRGSETATRNASQNRR